MTMLTFSEVDYVVIQTSMKLGRESPAIEVVIGLLSFLVVWISDTMNMVLFFQFQLKMAVHAMHKRKIVKWKTFDTFLRSINFIFMFFQEELPSFLSAGKTFPSDLEG